ncbi:ATP-binding protein [Sporosarcina limicola]|uniref:histidine kinase n=1 Tax=Sporosarcina limicola TaxID=34101 RepID=A0A927MJ19_9BACL|nr:sensor histidine kinase [Sporosarcina limicola]MBE1555619.1 two-component system sensor histidine kinase DctS [Sporosarcina limicola]
MNKISLRMKMFIFSFILVVFSVGTSGIIMIHNISVAFEKEIGARAIAIARTVAQLPDVKSQVGIDGGSVVIQPIAERVRLATDVDYIVIFDMEKIRYSHPSESKLGTLFEGGDEQASLSEHEYISKAQGVLGYAIRAFVPIMNEDGVSQVGVVTVGILSPTIHSLIVEYRNDMLLSLFWGLFIGLIGSLIIANHLKRQTLNLEPYEIARLVEERSSMMQAMDIGILATDAHSKIIFMNRLAKQYTNFYGDSIMLSELFPDTWLAKESQNGNEVIYRPLLCHGGMYLVRIYPIKVQDRPVGSLMMMTDRKEAHTLAEELTGIKTLVDALRAQNHEYMNKLHSIAGLMQLDRTEDALNMIMDEISDEQDVIQFLKDTISDSSVLGLLLGKRSRAKELGVILIIDEDSFLSEIMTGFSSGDMVTIIGNLVDNAMEACLNLNDRIVTILIQGNAVSLFIEVQDNGSGLPEKWGRIFEYGYSTKEKEGRGIGLALVKQIVESNKGEVSVCSQSDSGTTFTIKVGETQRND